MITFFAAIPKRKRMDLWYGAIGRYCVNKKYHVLWNTVSSVFVAIGLLLAGFSLSIARDEFGGFLFFITPIITGFVIAYMTNGIHLTLVTLLTSLVLSLLILLTTGLEGMICVVMAFPIILFSIGIGSLLGYFVLKGAKRDYGQQKILPLALAALLLSAWVIPRQNDYTALTVTHSVSIDAPLDRVWQVVVSPGAIHGDKTVLELAGLPVPLRCQTDGTQRICYFAEGEILQEITESIPNKQLRVSIVDAFPIRDWLAIERAAYLLEEVDGKVQLTRIDYMKSTLQPRWYWAYFESEAVQLEQDYVMQSMKTQAEQRREN